MSIGLGSRSTLQGSKEGSSGLLICVTDPTGLNRNLKERCLVHDLNTNTAGLDLQPRQGAEIQSIKIRCSTFRQ